LRIKRRQIGIRPGEKIHETLITAEENMRAKEEKCTFDNTPVTTIRSYFECEIVPDADAMSRYAKAFLPANSDFTSKDTKLLNPKETLSLLKEGDSL